MTFVTISFDATVLDVNDNLIVGHYVLQFENDVEVNLEDATDWIIDNIDDNVLLSGLPVLQFDDSYLESLLFENVKVTNA